MLHLIQMRDVTKSYLMGETVVVALSEIHLVIEQGGFTALMGPSGSGKSTILNLVGALDVPSKGDIYVNGVDLRSFTSNEKADFRARHVGFIFQTFNLIPVLTSLENVILPSFFVNSNAGRVAIERATMLLDRVGLAKQINQPINRLSGGQMQRVAIARALMNSPPIILADEPTANLDRVTAENVLTILKEVSASEGATVIIATHDKHVLNYCSRVIQLSDGRVIEDRLMSRISHAV